MNKTSLLSKLTKIVLLILSVVLFSCTSKAKNAIAENTAADKPNIILILADDLGYGDLSCYGQQKYSTPNIDKLAKEGIKFTQHYAGSTVCSPSRNSLMTGLHMGHAFIRGNGQNPNGDGDLPLPKERTTFVKYLKEAGYKTGIFGKWGLGDCDTEGNPLDHGFDEFFGYTNQLLAHNSYPEFLIKNCEKVYLKNEVQYLDKKDWHKGFGSFSTKKVEFSNDLIKDAALNFIEENKSNPFFLYFPTTIPHLNDEAKMGERFEVPVSDKFATKKWSDDEKNYALLITKLDSYVAEIENKLEELQLSNNTLIIFASDNGAVKEIYNLQPNGKLRGYKRDLYEGGIRVPLIVKWEGKIKPNTTSNHISAFWDYFPTLLEIAEVKEIPITDGISFLPTLLQKEQPQHENLYWEFHWWKPAKQALRKGKWKIVNNNILKPTNDGVELYNLDTDISEENNVAKQFPEIINELSLLMKESRTESENFPIQK